MVLVLCLSIAPVLLGWQGSPTDTQRVGRQWTLYNRAAGIEWQPLDLHVFQPAEPKGAGSPYGVARLDFLKNTREYAIEFRVRFGKSGARPSRLELWSGGRRPLGVSGGGDEAIFTVTSEGVNLIKEPLDDVWRSFRVVGDGQKTRIFLYGKEIGSTSESVFPDILVFGNWSDDPGTQTEAWLRLDKVTFQVARADDPEAAFGSSRVELVDLKQRPVLEGGVEKWRWVATLRVENTGRFAIDVAALPDLRIVSADYRETNCRPVVSLLGDEAFLPVAFERTLLAPGKMLDVAYASEASIVPGAKPERAEFGPEGRARNLPLPPP